MPDHANLLAGADLGTSGVKVAIFDTSGEVLATATATYPTTHAESGVVEQDPRDWWHATAEAFRVCGELVDLHRVLALGLTGQMQDVVLVAGDQPVRPALLYSDQRATAEHDALLKELPDWAAITGNTQDASSCASKLRWLCLHEPASVAAADRVLFGAPGYVALRAGGQAACDVTTASTTGLLDLTERAWSGPIALTVGLPVGLLPTLVDTAAVGVVSAGAAQELGLAEGTPIVHALGDAGSTTDALIGSATGEAYLYLGTTGWVASIADSDSSIEASVLHHLALPDSRVLQIGAVLSAGAASAWALATFLPGRDFASVEEELEPLMADLDPRSLPLCLPGLGGERTPVRDPAARGSFVGVAPDTTARDLYLATLLGVALNLKHAADLMGLQQDRIPVVGGGADSAVWRQLLANVFDAEIVTRSLGEVATRSAARAAADALGLPHTLAPLFETSGPGDKVALPGRHAAAYRELIAPHRQLFDALAPIFTQISTPRGVANERNPR